MRKGRAAVAALLVALGALAMFTLVPRAEADDCPAQPCIVITANGYSPDPVSVAGGTQVWWDNKDTKSHAVIADDGSFAQELSPNSLFSNTFNHQGSFGYHSNGSDTFRGTVNVTSDSPNLTTSTAPSGTAPDTNTTAPRTTAVVRPTVAKAVPTTYGGTLPLITVPTVPPTTTTTVAGPPTTGGEFAIGQAGSSNRGAIIAVVASGVAIAAAAGYLAYRRRLRSPF